MSEAPDTTTSPAPASRPAPPTQQASLGELVTQMQAQTSRLIRDELRLAQAETKAKAKSAGIGVGLFGGAGLFSLYGVGALVAAAILGLSIPLDGWLAALIVAAALFLIAGIAAVVGKKEVSQGTPPVPTEAVHSVSEDIHAIKPGSRS